VAALKSLQSESGNARSRIAWKTFDSQLAARRSSRAMYAILG